MNKEKSELTEEERELLRLLDVDLDLPPLPPDFESNVLAQLGITSDVPLSETDTGSELMEEERELLRLLDMGLENAGEQQQCERQHARDLQ